MESTHYFEGGKEVARFTQSKIKTAFIKPSPTHKYINTKLITLDIETKVIEGKMVPVCMSFYDGKVA